MYLNIKISKKKSKKIESHMELLLMGNEGNYDYVYIKDYNRFIYNIRKHKEKNNFCMNCLPCLNNKLPKILKKVII